jgi:hypothetical protein
MIQEKKRQGKAGKGCEAGREMGREKKMNHLISGWIAG